MERCGLYWTLHSIWDTLYWIYDLGSWLHLIAMWGWQTKVKLTSPNMLTRGASIASLVYSLVSYLCQLKLDHSHSLLLYRKWRRCAVMYPMHKCAHVTCITRIMSIIDDVRYPTVFWLVDIFDSLVFPHGVWNVSMFYIPLCACTYSYIWKGVLRLLKCPTFYFRKDMGGYFRDTGLGTRLCLFSIVRDLWWCDLELYRVSLTFFWLRKW
jgi:hypothetical protein